MQVWADVKKKHSAHAITADIIDYDEPTDLVAITVEYSATASKSDEVVVIRPGTDPAFALALAQVIIAEKLYREDFLREQTDLALLVGDVAGKGLGAALLSAKLQATVRALVPDAVVIASPFAVAVANFSTSPTMSASAGAPAVTLMGYTLKPHLSWTTGTIKSRRTTWGSTISQGTVALRKR